MTTLVLVRHGETEVNRDQKLHTDSDPNGLNPEGVEQITKTANRIKKLSPDAILSSKEKRAVQSAEIISKICGVGVDLIEGFQERKWGDLSGKTWPEIQKVLDTMSLEQRYNYVPPNGESWKNFDIRLTSNLRELTQKYRGTLVIVTHGGVIRALIPYLLDVPKEESFKYDPENASLTIFDFNRGRYIMRSINNVEHL